MKDGVQPADAWASGDHYEPFIGRWSRLVAAEFLDWLDAPTDAAWIDVGCGTGALSHAVLERTAPRSVVGVDPSAAFVEHARRGAGDPRANFRVGDAQRLEDPDDTYDVAVSALVLNFVPDPAQALAELRRVTRPGGPVAVYVWDYVQRGMQLLCEFWDAAAAVDPAAAALDEGRRFPICEPEPLTRLFTAAGLRDIESTAITVPTVFRDFDDLWSPFLGGQGPAPSYLAGLDDERRAAVREELRRRLQVSSDGGIALTARAWSVRGRSG
jgi:SAM-dependent methyltransferase